MPVAVVARALSGVGLMAIRRLDFKRAGVAEARRRMSESHQIFLNRMGTLDIGWSWLRLEALARDEGKYPEAEERLPSTCIDPSWISALLKKPPTTSSSRRR